MNIAVINPCCRTRWCKVFFYLKKSCCNFSAIHCPPAPQTLPGSKTIEAEFYIEFSDIITRDCEKRGKGE